MSEKESQHLDNLEVDEIFLTADGGVTKKILRQGVANELPSKGDEVKVHYVGRLLDGTIFDSSRDRNQEFSFKLGQGSVIKGWDIGVATMCKGENCILTCKPEYAYGATGSPPKIPGNSTLEFEVELRSFKNGEDISEEEDGSCVKYCKKDGSGYKKPRNGEDVVVDVVGKSLSGVEFLSRKNFSFVVGAADIPKSWNLAVKSMRKDEITIVKCSKRYASPLIGAEIILPQNEEKFEYEIHLREWISVDKVDNEGFIIKRTLREGEGYEKPNDGSTVKFRIKGEINGRVFMDQWNGGSDEGIEVVIGDYNGTVPESIEVALESMKKKELAEVIVKGDNIYGKELSMKYDLSPELSSTVVNVGARFTVEILSLVKSKEPYNMEIEEKLQEAENARLRGNEFVKNLKYEHALKKYKKIIKLLENETVEGGQKEKQNQLLLGANLNASMCHLKKLEYNYAVKSCQQALKLDENNVKAYYRLGLAQMEMNDFDLAKESFQKALKLEPNDKNIRIEYAKLIEKTKEQHQKDKALFSKMFAH